GEGSCDQSPARYGRETVLEATSIYMEQSERRTRAALAAIPAGIYRAVGHFDNDGITLDRPVRVEMAIEVRDGRMTVDFTGSDAQDVRPVHCGAAITDRLFIQGDLNAGGTGARPAYDGESAMIIFAGSTARNNPVEVVESRVPSMRVLRYGLRMDSGGAGKFRGGLGVERVYEFLAPAFITFSLERKATPPWGLRGGLDGAVNGVEIRSPDGSTRHVRKATQHPIAAGEIVRIMTGGGGGWGSPAERDPEAVRRDVREGYVSADAARRDYGARLNGS